MELVWAVREMNSRGPSGFRGEHGLWGSGVDPSYYLLAKNVAASCQYPEHWSVVPL